MICSELPRALYISQAALYISTCIITLDVASGGFADHGHDQVLTSHTNALNVCVVRSNQRISTDKACQMAGADAAGGAKRRRKPDKPTKNGAQEQPSLKRQRQQLHAAEVKVESAAGNEPVGVVKGSAQEASDDEPIAARLARRRAAMRHGKAGNTAAAGGARSSTIPPIAAATTAPVPAVNGDGNSDSGGQPGKSAATAELPADVVAAPAQQQQVSPTGGDGEVQLRPVAGSAKQQEGPQEGQVSPMRPKVVPVAKRRGKATSLGPPRPINQAAVGNGGAVPAQPSQPETAVAPTLAGVELPNLQACEEGDPACRLPGHPPHPFDHIDSLLQVDEAAKAASDQMSIDLEFAGFVSPAWADLYPSIARHQGKADLYKVPCGASVAMLRRGLARSLGGIFWPENMVLRLCDDKPDAFDMDEAGHELTLADYGVLEGSHVKFWVAPLPTPPAAAAPAPAVLAAPAAAPQQQQEEQGQGQRRDHEQELQEGQAGQQQGSAGPSNRPGRKPATGSGVVPEQEQQQAQQQAQQMPDRPAAGTMVLAVVTQSKRLVDIKVEASEQMERQRGLQGQQGNGGREVEVIEILDSPEPEPEILPSPDQEVPAARQRRQREKRRADSQEEKEERQRADGEAGTSARPARHKEPLPLRPVSPSAGKQAQQHAPQQTTQPAPPQVSPPRTKQAQQQAARPAPEQVLPSSTKQQAQQQAAQPAPVAAAAPTGPSAAGPSQAGPSNTAGPSGTAGAAPGAPGPSGAAGAAPPAPGPSPSGAAGPSAGVPPPHGTYIDPRTNDVRPQIVRGKRFWTRDETSALLQGVHSYSAGSWKDILQDSRYSRRLSRRSQVNCKDRWKNLVIAYNSGFANERIPLTEFQKKQLESLLKRGTPWPGDWEDGAAAPAPGMDIDDDLDDELDL